MPKPGAARLFVKLAFLFGPFLLLAAGVFAVIESPATTKRAYLDDKIARLITNTPERPRVIVAGDSRAQSNIIPRVLDAELKTNTANVAVGVGLLYQTVDALKKADALNHQSLIIISVSSYQISDGFVLDADPIDVEVIAHKQWGVQKIMDARNYFDNQYDYYFNRLKTFLRPDVSDPERMSEEVFAAKGYTEKKGLFASTSGPNTTDEVYQNVTVGGVKQKKFEEALRTLGATNDTVVIIEPPYAPSAWRAYDGTNAKTTEEQFADIIHSAIAPYPNMHMKHYALTPTTLQDSAFADSVHLNKAGAEIFTKQLARDVKSLLPKH
ncbi:MAG: hydrolase family protein [Patescibacteria group bacterium]|nr:hydrolase family protein [Patescibacteria group bacterium]